MDVNCLLSRPTSREDETWEQVSIMSDPFFVAVVVMNTAFGFVAVVVGIGHLASLP